MLKWTSEPPQEPGWYFVRTSKVFVVRVDRTADGVMVAWTGPVRQYVRFYVERLRAEFAGPIPGPEDA